MKHCAIYPISANPPTNGHADILKRASAKFDHVYWVAALNPNKELLFNNEERLAMMQMYVDYHKLNNVTVDSHDKAIMRYARMKQVQFLIRGLRNTSDFQQEIELATANYDINPDVETICFLSLPHYSMMSSSIVRELVGLNESFGRYVIPSVEELIKKKIKF